MGLFTVYVILMIFCGIHASRLFPIVKHEASNKIDDLKLDEIVMNISKDESHCFPCTERHVGFPWSETLIEKQQLNRERYQSLKRIRTFFNSLWIMNSIIVFLAFGSFFYFVIFFLVNFWVGFRSKSNRRFALRVSCHDDVHFCSFQNLLYHH